MALWSVTRIEGDIFDHESLDFRPGHSECRSASMSMRSWALAAPAGGRPCGRGRLSAAFLAAVFLGLSRLALAVNDRSFKPGDDELAAEALSGEIIRDLQDRHVSKVLLDVDGPAWPVAAGVVVQLEKKHIPFAVAEDAVWMFGDATAPRGDEARTIAISRERHHEQIWGSRERSSWPRARVLRGCR